MDFSGVRRRRTHQHVVEDSLQEMYPCDLQMYTTPPGQTITLTEFEELAIDRLKVLRTLEVATIKSLKFMSDEWKNFVKAELKKEGLKTYLHLLGFHPVRKEVDYQARRADHISHHILCLAYSRSHDLRSWFLKQELELFRLRFLSSSQEEIMKFFELNNITFTPISDSEKNDVRNELIESTTNLWGVTFDTVEFYRIRFEEVLNLISKKSVYVNKGYAFVPSTELIVCVQSIFRAQLSHNLAVCSQWIGNLNDARITDFIQDIDKAYTGKDYNPDEQTLEINIEKMDYYAKNHFPMCMRAIHEVLRATHEMKYGCRMQYGLFLKGIGVSYEDSMRFWQEEFMQRITGDQFQKQYAYGIKHNYGKVGSRINYTPYSCSKIIDSSVGPTEHHGCPFRHYSLNILKLKLHAYGVSTEGILEIENLVKGKHYQIACNKYFEYTHSRASPNVIGHPNQYFEESIKLYKEKMGVKSQPQKPTGKSQDPVASTSSTPMEIGVL